MKNHIKDLGIIAAATFDAMLSEGISLLEIMYEMDDAVFALMDRYKALGMEVPDHLKSLFRIFRAFRDNPEFFEGLQGLADMFDGLGNSFNLTEDAFKALNREARRYYQILTMSKEEGGMGFGDEQAIRLMYPVLQKMWWYAEQYGMKLPKWAREAIQKAKDLGLEFEAPIANQQLDVIKTIADEAMTANKYLSLIHQGTKDLVAAIAGPGYASGTPNIKRTHYARIHAGEAVVPGNLAESLRYFFSGNLSMPGGGSGGGQTIVIQLDSRELYRGLLPRIREGGSYGDFELAGEGIS
jgi:hypothetical protein